MELEMKEMEAELEQDDLAARGTAGEGSAPSSSRAPHGIGGESGVSDVDRSVGDLSDQSVHSVVPPPPASVVAHGRAFEESSIPGAKAPDLSLDFTSEAGRNQEDVAKAIALIERNPEFPDVLVQIYERNQAVQAHLPNEAKQRLSEARLEYHLKLVEIFGEAHLRLVTDLESVKALKFIMVHFVRATWLEISGIPLEEIKPSPRFAQPHPTQSQRDTLLSAAQHWVMKWYDRLGSLRKDQPEVVTQEQPSTRRKILEPNVDSLANPDLTQAKAVNDSDPDSPPDSGPLGEPGKRVAPRPVEAPASESPPPPAAIPVEAAAENRLFRKSGAYWTLAFGGRERITVKSSKGMQYIAYLLQCPNQLRTCIELVGAAGGQKDLPTLGSGGDALDPVAVARYKRHKEDLDDQLAEAERNCDQGRKEAVQMEMQELDEEIEKAFGLGGRHRRLSDDAEKLRKSVSNAVQRAIKEIQKHDSALADHLKRHIELGLSVRYCSDSVEWKL
jgi:hypothetical protein